jgi:DNA polymerase-1
MSKVIAFDTETERFTPGNMAPRLACVSACVPGEAPSLIERKHAADWFLDLANDGYTFVGHSLSYDTAVLCNAAGGILRPHIFKLYQDSRFLCTMITEQLLDISEGCFRFKQMPDGTMKRKGYSLADVYKQYTRGHMAKGQDTWRLRYGELADTPIAYWPEDARSYALDDAKATAAVYTAQQRRNPSLRDSYRQTRHDFWLRLTSNHGFMTSGEGVARLEAETLEVLTKLKDELTEAKLIKPNGVKDTKRAKALMTEVCEEEGLPLRLTDSGAVSLDAEACRESGNNLLQDYAALTSLSTVLKKDVKFLREGINAPVHTRFSLVATGRTSSSGPNIQNIRRLPGIRECFIPRPDWLFAQADYDGLELRTLAQVCKKIVGYSQLGTALNAGKDPHLMFAAKILHITYEAAARDKKAPDVKQARQLAKAFNFGKPGGLGSKNFQAFAKATYGVILTPEEIRVYTNMWFEEWPEIKEYHTYIGNLCKNSKKTATIEHLFSRRVRAGASFCAAANSYFQGLGSDATKHAGWLITKACYNDATSPLFGCRMVNYIHDEFIVEVPDNDSAEAAANELARLMREGAAPFLPDYPATTEPLLMRYWSKDAERVVVDGRLIAWPA